MVRTGEEGGKATSVEGDTVRKSFEKIVDGDDVPSALSSLPLLRLTGGNVSVNEVLGALDFWKPQGKVLMSKVLTY